MTDPLSDAGATAPASAASADPTTATEDRWPRSRGRVSKWDRPPDPRDWRFVVGTSGKVLIATGILLFGFVAYQLWGTGIETARAQNALEDEFEAALAAHALDTPTEVTDQRDAAGGSTAAAEPPLGTADVEGDVGRDVGSETGDGSGESPPDARAGTADDPGTDAPAGVPAEAAGRSAAPVDVAVEQDVPEIVPGRAIARLDMPTIGRSLYVVPGVGVDDLKDGPGHYPDTPLPGQLGNSAIAGHRTTYGEPFIDLDDLAVGDELVVATTYGTFVYEVSGAQVVSPADSWVVQTTDWERATLTLTTCHPKYTARDRLIVFADLNPDRSSAVGVPTFYDLDGVAGEVPGDDPTIDTAPTADTSTTDATTTADTTTTTADTAAPPPPDASGGADVDPAAPPVATAEIDAEGEVVEPSEVAAADGSADRDVPAPPVPVGGPSAEQPTPEDAFARGWFDDARAFPQIALWGAGLVAISLLAYAVSRRARHDSVGFLLGIGPFAVALYFFFQNVHRLLPPGI